MVSIYLVAIRHGEGGRQCAVYHHIRDMKGYEADGINNYPDGSCAKNKMRQLIRIIPQLPKGDIKYCVFTDDHSLTWDLEQLSKGEEPGFQNQAICNKLLYALKKQGIDPACLRSKENGMFSIMERDAAKDAFDILSKEVSSHVRAQCH